ncbi:MAG: ABC transporter substrate-binding protein [Deltaproteobacteria bacterium]|nr:ABC transporter substrate-binding protein [Deltaproteobacteria bacterium]
MAQLFLVLALISSIAEAAITQGNPKAPKGGSITIALPGYPKSLLSYTANEQMSQTISSLVLESLLDMDVKTYDFIPLLASEWKISPDKKIFTFKLNPNARFSDGTKVTAEDIKFTWDAIMNPKHKTAPFRSVFASIESCQVLDETTVQFRAKYLHFKNLEKLAGLTVLPRHFFSKGDFNKSFNSKLLGSGPYVLGEVKQGERIILTRNPNWWGAGLPQNVGKYNFDKIVYKSTNDPNVQFEVFKRGDLDVYAFYSAKMWTTQTSGRPFDKNYIAKLRAETSIPSGMQGFFWNLRRPLFKDRRVRLALSHLTNRERWVKDLFYNNYQISAGILNLNSEYRSPQIKPVPYDPKKARQLLNEAGWTEVGKDGILVKDGLRFEFELLEDNPMSSRYLTLYQEDLKNMGIKLNIRVVDWATALKLSDDRQFDAKSIKLTGSIHPSDFRQIWGSEEADIKGSTNYTGYKNPDVDTLAQKIDETFDKALRIPLVRKLEEMIHHDQPIAMAWELVGYRLAYWNKFSFPGKGFFPYTEWEQAIHYWWWDKEKEEKLKKAMAGDLAFTKN